MRRKAAYWLASLVALAAAFVLLLVSPAWAGGTDIEQNTDIVVDTGDIVNENGQNVNTGGNKHRSLALANSLGDVDINACLASTQWATPLYSKQKIILNPWCAALVADTQGKHDQAARIRCNIPAIKKLYRTSGRWIFAKYDLATCVTEWSFSRALPEPVVDEVRPANVLQRLEEAEEDRSQNHVVFSMQQEQMIEQIEILQNEIEGLRLMPAPAVIDPEIQARLDADAERRARAAEIIEKGKAPPKESE